MLVDFQIIDMFIDALQDRSALRVAAQETLADRRLVRRVRLRHYYVPWQFEFDVDVNGVHFTTIPFALVLELGVTNLDATIQRGQLVKIDGGRASVRAVLTVHHIDLVSAQLLFKLRNELRFASGIELT